MNYKFNEIENADEYEISEITDIILLSNQTSLIAKLGKNFVKKFIKLCIVSKNVNLFTLSSGKTNIAYAIFFKKEKLIVQELSKLKYLIILTIIFKLKFNLLYNILLIYFRKDISLKSETNTYDIPNSVNLTYLAVKASHRQKGIGRIFIENILKKNYSNQYISVETDNKKTLNFYTKYLNFKIIGSRKRFYNNLYLLIRKNNL
tara:strand:- start:22 stop:633 length:612 start_codon:yes stop_codon:yes gene_type:complete